MRGLKVGTTFAGDHPVGAGQGIVEVQQIQGKFSAGNDFRFHEVAEREAESAGRAVAGQLGGMIDHRRLMRRQIEVLQPGVKPMDLFRGRPFLRTEDRGRAKRSGQGIGDVAGHPETAFPNFGTEVTYIDHRDFTQHSAGRAVRELPPLPVDEFNAQRLKHADAAVYGGAAADADGEMADVFIDDQVAEQFAGPVGRGLFGIELLPAQELDAAGAGHFQHCAMIGQAAPACRHRPAQRVGNLVTLHHPAQGGAQRLRGAFAAVAQRQGNDFPIGLAMLDCPTQNPVDIRARQAVFERVERQNDFHERLLSLIVRCRKCARHKKTGAATGAGQSGRQQAHQSATTVFS
ncbi:hypothetical protein SDC9_92198 [bioreactor metagenome]|uniref:Uncharacterized protein n=1 Tax=bioreactor metagenome TaxID=1076179 RepID=A0A644ZZW2_9ZZZZ